MNDPSFLEKSQQGWIEIYQRCGTLWIHDNNPKRPHALLTSGKHSNGFFNSGVVCENPILLDRAADELVTLMQKFGLHIDDVDRVVGPAMGAVTLAFAVARHIGERRGRTCLCAYAEKSPDGKTMLLSRSNLRLGEHVLCVEDVITTGESIGKTLLAVAQAGGEPLPFVGALVNRSSQTRVHNAHSVQIQALVSRAMPAWTAEECPLCSQGSEAIRPKGVENWLRLNAEY